MKCKSASAFFFNMFKLCEYGQEVNRLLLMMNFCMFKNISVFRVFVKSVEPNNNKSVFRVLYKIFMNIVPILIKSTICKQ